MIKVLDHPLVHNDISIIRNKNTTSSHFRDAVKRISYHLAIESMFNLDTLEINVETPLEITTGKKINTKVLVIPILRAGLSLLPAFQEIYPDLIIGYAALKRNEETFESEEYYYNIPKISKDYKVIILEVMLATGGSINTLLSKLEMDGITNITVCSIVSAPEGLEKIGANFPNVEIITAVIDRELNEKKYILPGLGDAGDRINNT